MKINELKEDDIVHIKLNKNYINFHPLLTEIDAIVKSSTKDNVTILAPIKNSSNWTLNKEDVDSLSLKNENEYIQII